jgi:hypothetical protein
MTTVPKETPERIARRRANFDAKWMPEPMSGCWLWLGCTTRVGYGRVWVRDRLTTAHRFAYERWVGPISEGLQVDHLCRQRCCVNPEHLEAVTARENTLRGTAPAAANARKVLCKNGHPLSGPNLTTRPCGRRACVACIKAYYQTRLARRSTSP